MRIGVVAAVVMVMGVGCAASGAGDPPPVDPAHQKMDTVESYCHARALAECNDTVVSKCAVTDAKSCVAARSSSCTRTAPQGTELVTAQAPVCVQLVVAAYADAVLTGDELTKIGTACGPALFSGPGAARSPCTTSYDCRSIDGLSCLIPDQATAGKCMKLQPVAASGACPGEADQCPDGYFCESKAKICQAQADSGEPCDPLNHPCKAGLTCPTNPFAGGTCQGKWSEGHPCKADADCGSNICARQPAAVDGNCSEAIVLSPLDGACAIFKGPATTTP
jgi:hypothetical protein